MSQVAQRAPRRRSRAHPVLVRVMALPLAALQLAAVLLSPWRLGRLVRAINVPRMREHGLRTSLTVMGVALGVAVLLAVGVVSGSILRSISATLDDLAGKSDLHIASGNSGFSEDLIEQVRAVAGVGHVAPVLQQIVSIRDDRLRHERLLVLGVDLLNEDDAYFRDYQSKELAVLKRGGIEFLNSTTNIVLSRQFAERHGYKLHDHIRLLGARGIEAFEIWGFIDSPTVGRAFGGAVAVMYYPAMQLAFGRGRNVDRLELALQPGTSASTLQARLQERLGDAYEIGPPKLRGEHLGKMLGSVRMALSMAGVVALLTGLFLIYNTMCTSVLQRRQELSILRALGSTRRDLLWMITLEGALLGVMGALLGTALGLGLARVLLHITSQSVEQVYMQLAVSELHVPPELVAVAVVLGVVGATVASIVPAYRAASIIRPTESVRVTTLLGAPGTGGSARRDGLALALILGAVGLMQLAPVQGLPVGAAGAATCILVAGALSLPRFVQLLRRSLQGAFWGVEVALARDNLGRNMGRTVITASTLMAGVALAVGFATFMESFVGSLDTWTWQVLPGDLFVTSGAPVSGLSARNTPLAPDLAERLKAIEGVREVRALRLSEIDYAGTRIKLASTQLDLPDAQIHLQPTEGSERALVRRLAEEPVVAISENLARRFGLGKGDSIAFATAHGTQRFEIAAVVVDYTSDLGAVTLDRRTYVRAFGDDRVDTFEVRVQPTADVERVRREINARYGESHDLFVLTNREFRQEFAKAVDQIYQVLRTIEFATILVAAFGIINSLLMGVLDRVREIGILRALGMLRRQIRKTVVLEAALLCAIGIAAGLLTGLAIGYVMVEHIMLAQLGWSIPYAVPLRSIAELCLAIFPVALLAGWYPAWRASGLIVRDALAYEE